MNNSKRTILVFIALIVVIAITIGVTYAFFNYTKVSTKSHSIISGNISLTYNEEVDTLSLTNVFPETPEEARLRNDNFITFTISGVNTSTKDINYEIDLIHGNDITEKTRFLDNHLRFDLEETIGANTNLVVNNMSYNDLTNYLSIWVGHVPANTSSSITRTYKLRMWLSDEVTISDTNPDASYTTSVFRNSYASIKARVQGDFNEHDYVKSAYRQLLENAIPSNIPSEFVTDSNGINFGQISSDTNGKGLYILSETANDEYPVVFFRGNINNNNVLFADCCWQIVRTSETGGIKMIYNGVATEDYTTCENVSHSDRIAIKVPFNEPDDSMSDIGFMHNERYPLVNEKPSTGVYFGTDIEYGDFDSNGTREYRLISGMTSTTLDGTHHYTCNLTSSTGTCTTIRYYYFYGSYEADPNYVYINLSNGDKVEDAIYKMTGNGSDSVKSRNSGYVLNKNNSTIKDMIELFSQLFLSDEIEEDTNEKYNEINYLKYLENTIWCNERSFALTGANSLASSSWNPTSGYLIGMLHIGVSSRQYLLTPWYSTTIIPQLECPNITDQFKVGNSKAPLNYPVGLITGEEAYLAGASGNETAANKKYYLYTGGYFWTISAGSYNSSTSMSLMIFGNGAVMEYGSGGNIGLKPMISLKYGMSFLDGGDGTPTNPYVVKIN